jgi:outer membrane autotransporter protein
MNTDQFSALRSAYAVYIFALFTLVSASASMTQSALAQTAGTSTGANGNITVTDPMGNQLTVNTNNVMQSPAGMAVTITLPNGTTIPVSTVVSTPLTVTLANGTSRTDPLSIQFLPGNLASISANSLLGPISCTINVMTLQTAGGSCGGVGSIFGALVSGGTGGVSMGLTPAQAAAMATAPSAKSAAAGAVRSQTLQVTNMISDRIRSISRDLASGLGQPSGQLGASTYRGISAGSADTRWGVWGDASGSFIGNNSSVGYDGTSVVALSGIDYILDPNWLVGFNAGYTNGQLGLKSFTGTRTSNGALVGPYASYIISPNFSVDGQFSYTRLSNNISTVAPGPTGGFNSNRYTGAADLNAYTDSDGIKLTLFTGYAYTYEGGQSSVLSNVPPFTNSIRFGVFKLGGEAGYPTGDFEPYLPLTFEYQTTKPQDQTGRAALRVGIGVRYQWTDQLKGGLLFTATEFQENWRDLKIEGNLRWTF